MAKTVDRPIIGILCIIVGMGCISVNDLLMKLLSGDYPLHQMVFVRSAIGIIFSLVILQFEGGFAALRTSTPGLHAIRGVAIVFANMTFFAALAAMPIASATALFFVAPLFITLLSIPVLGETVGPRRIGAVIAGFVGVLIMMQPDPKTLGDHVSRWILLLPVVAAFGYAWMQILTRKLGIAAKASAMAVYLQLTFIIISLGFWLIAGDGRFVENTDNPSLLFLLRAWKWPANEDQWLFLVLGLNSAVIAYTLSQAYRLASASTVAPFEYIALPLAVFWGWLIWDDLPGVSVAIGMLLIMASGIYVFLREGARQRPVSSRRPIRRH